MIYEKPKAFAYLFIVFLFLTFLSIFAVSPSVSATSYNYTMNVSSPGGSVVYQIKNSGGSVVYQSGSSSSSFNTMMSYCSSGYNIYVYSGAYSVDATWLVSVPNIILTFQSGAVLTAVNNLNSIMLELASSYIIVSGITINGNGLHQSPAATTKLTGANFNDGIQFDMDDCLVQNAVVYNVRCFGILTAYGIDCSNDGVINSLVYDIGANGLMAGWQTTTNCYFTGNEVYGCGDVGIDTYGDNTKITDNYIHDCYGSSCPLWGYAGIPSNPQGSAWGIANEWYGGSGSGNYELIARNVLSNVGTGIALAGGSAINYNILSGNTLSNCDENAYGAIQLNDASYNIIEFNSITTANVGLGLASSSCNSNNVFGNTFTGCSTNIYNAGTGTTYTAPSIVAVTVTSSPTGVGYITAAGSPGYAGAYSTSPYTFYKTVGNSVALVANTVSGHTFASWSDSGAQSHSITVPSTNTVYTATYTSGGTPTPTPTPGPTSTASPLPTPTPTPGPTSGNFLITQTPFIINYSAGQAFAVQSISPASTINFAVTSGLLNGTGNVNASNTGGIFQILPTTSGTLLITTSGTPVSVYIDGVYANNIPFNFFPGDPVITWDYGSHIVINNNGIQYFFRSDTYTTLGVTGNGFDADYTNTAQSINETYSGTSTVNYGFQVYLFSSPTRYTELTTGPSATMAISGVFNGAANSSINIPLTAVTLGYQAIQIKLLEQYGSGSWITVASFISPVLITDSIEASTWTFTLQIQQTQNGGNTQTAVTFGDSDYRSGVNNIVFSKPQDSEIQAWRLSHIDLSGFELASYMNVLGTGFYALLLLLFAGVLYFRYGHFGTVSFFFVLFGGSGGLAFVFLPLWAAGVTAAFVILGTTFIVWRIIR